MGEHPPAQGVPLSGIDARPDATSVASVERDAVWVHKPFKGAQCQRHAVLLQQEWVQGEDEERSSSDGRGSSYFSGERLDQGLSSTASPMHSQQSLTGHVDRASLVSVSALILSQHVCMGGRSDSRW